MPATQPCAVAGAWAHVLPPSSCPNLDLRVVRRVLPQVPAHGDHIIFTCRPSSRQASRRSCEVRAGRMDIESDGAGSAVPMRDENAGRIGNESGGARRERRPRPLPRRRRWRRWRRRQQQSRTGRGGGDCCGRRLGGDSGRLEGGRGACVRGRLAGEAPRAEPWLARGLGPGPRAHLPRLQPRQAHRLRLRPRQHRRRRRRAPGPAVGGGGYVGGGGGAGPERRDRRVHRTGGPRHVRRRRLAPLGDESGRAAPT